jgi:lysophospholipase L1-like esterase
VQNLPRFSRSWLAIGAAVVSAVAAGAVLASEAFDPGPDGPAKSAPTEAGEPLVIRALGDSVTAGFGYDDDDGSQISVGDLLRTCKGSPADPDCQDPDGVAYSARFAARRAGNDFENLALAGSTPADWLGEGEQDLNPALRGVVEDDPDVTVLTVGANPLLNTFLFGGDRLCATDLSASAARTCVRRALLREQVLPRLVRIYATLLNTPAGGREGLVIVFQYPETRPPSSIGVRVKVLLDELRATITRAAEIVREGDPRRGVRLVVAEPGPFDDHGCFDRVPWILRVDTCIHPNFRGHEQLAEQLARAVREAHGRRPPRSGAVRPPGGMLSAAVIGPARIGMSQAAVRGLFAAPDRTALGGQNWLWDYPNPGWIHTEDLSGVVLSFSGGRLRHFSCTVPDCVSSGGIRVGDSIARLRDVYGPRLIPHPDNPTMDLIVPGPGPGQFPALEFSGPDAGRVISIGGGYSLYRSGQPSGVVPAD